MTLRLVAHWATTATSALVVETAAPLPFTGPYGEAARVLAAAAVAAIGYACAPTPAPRKEQRS